MNNAPIAERYFAELPALNDALSSWKTRLTAAADQIDTSAFVEGRVKTFRSVLGKVYRKPAHIRTWNSLGDLVALKVVFPTTDGVDEFTAWLQAQSSWLPELEIKVSAPEELKYQSMQFDLVDDVIVQSDGSPLKLEVQVRTAAADAWYVVDHRLRYKGPMDLPRSLKRKILRLIVLTELFDEEVSSVISEQANLPEYSVVRLYAHLLRLAQATTREYVQSTRPEGLMELLRTAYGDESDELVEAQLTTFVGASAEKFWSLLVGHLYSSPRYVESRDWIYAEPEALLVAERSLNKPAMLRAIVAGSDFEPLLVPMMAEFREGLR